MSQLRLCWRRNAQGRYWCVSVRRRPSGQGCEERTLWLGGHDWKVSTWSGDGHFQGSSGRDRIEGEPDGDRQAAAAKRGGEASNRRRDVGGRCVGGESGASAWGQRQSGLWLAQAISRGATGRQWSGQALAGSRQREFAVAGNASEE